jgi:hypothetical protein
MSVKHRNILLPVFLSLLTGVATTVLVFATTRQRQVTPATSGGDESSSRPSSIAAAPNTTGTVESPQAQGTVRGPIQNIRFTVYDVGIYPRSCRVGRGLVAISIEDRTGNSAGVLIERMEGNARIPLGRVTRRVNELRGRERLRLEPGKYRISDSNPQSSDAVLTVEP